MNLEFLLQPLKTMAQTLIRIEVQIADSGCQKFLITDLVHILKTPKFNPT